MEDKTEKQKEYNKKYRAKNREEILKKKKIYRENNKEEIKEYNKKYYQDNKDEIFKKIKEKVECDICKSLITKRHLSRHHKTKKCMNAK